VSPTGSHIAFVSYGRLHLRAIDQLESVIVGASGDPLSGPFFSPDGHWLGYWQEGQLRKVAVGGGAAVTICQADIPTGVTWPTGDTIVFGQGAKGIWRVPADGGRAEPISPVDASRNEMASDPQLLADGHTLLYTVAAGARWADARIVATDLRSGAVRTVVEGAMAARVLPTGHLVYVQRGALVGVPFDVRTLQPSGVPVSIVDSVQSDILYAGLASFSISRDGLLTYIPGGDLGVPVALTIRRTLVWVDREGHEESTGLEPGVYEVPRLSPDGERVALQVGPERTAHIAVYDLRRKTLSRLTFDERSERRPVWSSDGSFIYFRSDAEGPGIYRKVSDGSGRVEKVTTTVGDGGPNFASPDGRTLLFNKVEPLPVRRAWTLRLDDRQSQPLLLEPGSQSNGAISPDNRWVAYSDDLQGGQIVVRPFPNTQAGRWLVVAAGAKWPLWSRDGRELFYQTERALMSVPVEASGASFQWGTPKQVLQGAFTFFGGLEGPRSFDVSLDGRRFLLLKDDAVAHASEPRIIVVENWFQELQQRVPTPAR
jgi:serine/threonine-protein kinase